MMETFLEGAGLDDNPIFKRMMEGETGAQAMGLSRDELEVLYSLGFGMLSAGDVQKAYDVFFQLVMIDPFEAKNHYCMGVVKQMQGNFKAATEQFVNFLALDATNPQGYLRLGECKLALGQKDVALEAFKIAEIEAARGNGDAETLAEAKGKIALLNMETPT